MEKELTQILDDSNNGKTSYEKMELLTEEDLINPENNSKEIEMDEEIKSSFEKGMINLKSFINKLDEGFQKFEDKMEEWGNKLF
jgi:hypothetical protein